VNASGLKDNLPQHILVLEDHEDTLVLLEIILRNAGFTVDAANRVAKAMAAFEQRKPDLMLVDLSLPDGDGFSFVQWVRTMPESAGGKVPAIALSAFSGQKLIGRLKDAGFDRYVPKPVRVDALRRAVLEFLPVPTRLT
jgi:CheY-like chemotaxis protein